jgi:hypothetical protein
MYTLRISESPQAPIGTDLDLALAPCFLCVTSRLDLAWRARSLDALGFSSLTRARCPLRFPDVDSVWRRFNVVGGTTSMSDLVAIPLS